MRRITVESDERRGSTLRVRVPLPDRCRGPQIYVPAAPDLRARTDDAGALRT